MKETMERHAAREEVAAVLVILLIWKHHFVPSAIREEQTSQTRFAEFVVEFNLAAISK